MSNVDRVNQLNRAFTVIFTEAMQSIKPVKEIEKIKTGKNEKEKKEKEKRVNDEYEKKIKEWQNAFSFNQKLRHYVNELNNLIVLAGGSNSSKGANDLTKDNLEKLRLEINSEEFDKNMKSCAPKIKEDAYYSEKKIKWDKTFIFPTKLKEFIKKLEDQSKPIPAKEFLALVDFFIKELQVGKNEFLIKATQAIGEEEYKIDSDVIEERAKEDIKEVVKNIETKDPNNPKKEEIEKIMEDAKKNELEIIAENKIVEKKYDKAKFNFELDEELVKAGAQAVKKMFPQYMNAIAIASLVGILGLVVLSVTCPGCTFETSEQITTTEGIDEEGNNFTTITTESVPLVDECEEWKSFNPLCGFVGNPYTQILESNVVMILVSTFIAPMAARILKEKFDIDVKEKDISMIASDGIKSVTMFAKEADQLRDANGNIPRKYQKTLRDKAFNSMKENYKLDKYKDLVASVGAQTFEKVIEDAVQSGRIERFPLEKKQIEELIKQGIDAVPQIVEWQKHDQAAKHTFIDGNIRKLLQNAGLNRWSHKALENVFDAEMSKRLIGAAFLLKDKAFEQLDLKDPYLKYTSTVIDAFLEREKTKTVIIANPGG